MSIDKTALGEKIGPDQSFGQTYKRPIGSFGYRDVEVWEPVKDWFLKIRSNDSTVKQPRTVFSEYLEESAKDIRLVEPNDGYSRRERDQYTSASESFEHCADFMGFDDPRIVRMVHAFADRNRTAIRRLLTLGFAFFYKQPLEKYGKEDDLENAMIETRQKFDAFITLLHVLEFEMGEHAHILKKHPLFADFGQSIVHIRTVLTALMNVQIRCSVASDADTFITEQPTLYNVENASFEKTYGERNIFSLLLPPTIAQELNMEDKTFQPETFNALETYVDFLHMSELKDVVPPLLATAGFMDYCRRTHDADRERFGVLPHIEDTDEAGLKFSFSGLHNAILAWGDSGNGLMYDKKSVAFGNFSLGSVEDGTPQTITVLPGPNMAGKTTFMKAVGFCLHLGKMGRKVPCTEASMSLPDMIHHNFNLHDDIQRQLSTFKAQLHNTQEFLATATVHSLGLFDELYNGTSADYQLALAWAFLEECAAKNLRLIVSTHNHALEFFSDPDGFEKIRNMFAIPQSQVQAKGSMGARTLSIDSNHTLREGSQRDSKALEIVRDVFGARSPFFRRSEEILRHIRGI